MVAVFEAAGCEVLDFGLSTTPALFMATQFEEFACDAGIMLTASHLPFYFNGIKIFSQAGGAEKVILPTFCPILNQVKRRKEM